MSNAAKTAEPSQSIVLIGSDTYRGALEPVRFEDALRVAEGMASAGLFGLKSAPEALGKIMFGRTIGITAIQSLQSLHSIEGKIGMDASLMMALCLRAKNICEYFEPVLGECTAEKAVCIAKRVGRPEQRFEFTMEDAQRMGVVDRGKDAEAKKKNNWNTSPRDMLLARCKSKLARQVFPDITHGMYTTDELYDAMPDADEMVGEVVGAAPPAVRVPLGVVTTVQAPARDYGREADSFIDRFKAAATKEDRAVVRAEFEKWDGVDPFRQKVKDAYGAIMSAAKKAEKAAERPTEKAEPASPVASTATSAPAASPGLVPEGSLFDKPEGTK